MTPAELLATVLFGLAVLHTFCVKQFAHWAHQYPPGSVRENLLHFLAETEVVFGLWAATLFLGVAAIKGSFNDAASHLDRGSNPRGRRVRTAVQLINRHLNRVA